MASLRKLIGLSKARKDEESGKNPEGAIVTSWVSASKDRHAAIIKWEEALAAALAEAHKAGISQEVMARGLSTELTRLQGADGSVPKALMGQANLGSSKDASRLFALLDTDWTDATGKGTLQQAEIDNFFGKQLRVGDRARLIWETMSEGAPSVSEERFCKWMEVSAPHLLDQSIDKLISIAELPRVYLPPDVSFADLTAGRLKNISIPKT